MVLFVFVLTTKENQSFQIQKVYVLVATSYF